MTQPMITHSLAKDFLLQISQDQQIDDKELSDLFSILPFIKQNDAASLDSFLLQIESEQITFSQKATTLFNAVKRYWQYGYPVFYKNQYEKNEWGFQKEGSLIISAFVLFVKKSFLLGVPENIFEFREAGDDSLVGFMANARREFVYSENFRDSSYHKALFIEASEEEGLDYLRKQALASSLEGFWLHVSVRDEWGQLKSFWFEVSKDNQEKRVNLDIALVHKAFIMASTYGQVEKANLFHNHPEGDWGTRGVAYVIDYYVNVPEILAFDDWKSALSLIDYSRYYEWPVLMGNGAVSGHEVVLAQINPGVDYEQADIDLIQAYACGDPVINAKKQEHEDLITQRMLQGVGECYSETTGFNVGYRFFDNNLLVVSDQ